MLARKLSFPSCGISKGIKVFDKSFSGYRVFKFVLFLAGFVAAFFLTYLLCSGYLTDHLPEKALEHKDQVLYNFNIKDHSSDCLNYVTGRKSSIMLTGVIYFKRV